MLRRIVSVAVCVCLLFTVFSAINVSVSAENSDKAQMPDGLFETVKSAAENFINEVDISEFEFVSDREEVLSEAIVQITNLPELFYVSGEFKYSTEKLYLQYEYTRPQAVKMMTDISSVAESITGDLLASNLSDEHKALLIHDRLALLCEYDYENYLLKSIPFDSFTMYGALVKGVAVCEGYAKAYQYMLDLVGIESYLCESANLRHMWNIVTIDGEKYHVDVTYDDPVWDITGRVTHNNFLLSTEKLLKTGDHTAYDYDSSPDSTKYDNYYWQSSNAAFQHINGEVYYFNSITGELKQASNGKTLDTVPDRWHADESHVWVGYYTRLATDGENIYYSENNAIYIYHPSTGFKHKIYVPRIPENSEIYGFSYEQNKFVIEYNDTPNFDESTKESHTIHIVFELSENRFTGLVSDDNNRWHYVIDGVEQKKTGIYKIADCYYYIKNGIRRYNTGFVRRADGKYCYVKNGIWQNKFDGLVKHNNRWYYTANGIRQYNTGFVKHTNGKYYYVKSGVWQRGYNALVKHNNKWYYTVNGIRQYNTGFIRHTNGKYYYVKNGIWQRGYKGLVKHNGKWYYAVNGIRQYTTRLVKHTNGKYYYVKNGIVRNKFTGTVKINGRRYYIKNGIYYSA